MSCSQTLFNGNDLIIKFLALAEIDFVKALHEPLTLEHVRKVAAVNQFFTSSHLNEKFHAWIEDVLKTYSKPRTNAILKFLMGDEESNKVKAFFNFIKNIDGWGNFSAFDEGAPDFVKVQKSSGIAKSSEQKQGCLLQNKNELNSVNFSQACSILESKTQSLAAKQKLDELLKRCLDYKKAIISSEYDEQILKKLEDFIARIQQRLKFTDVYTPPALDSKI